MSDERIYGVRVHQFETGRKHYARWLHALVSADDRSVAREKLGELLGHMAEDESPDLVDARAMHAELTRLREGIRGLAEQQAGLAKNVGHDYMVGGHVDTMTLGDVAKLHAALARQLTELLGDDQ